jgi:hypothetical protein
MTSPEKTMMWAKIALGVASAGFAAAMYLNHYASTAVVGALGEKLDAHIVQETAKISTIDERSKNTEDDYHQMQSQLWEIAHTVGATTVPLPDHRSKK